MLYGMNLILWTDIICEEAIPLLDELKNIGFDAVEIPMFELDLKEAARWGKRLDELDLTSTVASVRMADENPASSDPAVRRRGVEANCRTLDCCAAAGCRVMAGPFHSAIGHFSGKGPTKDEWRWAVESMQQVAEHAAKVDVLLSVEPLNRFECYLLNTAADAARFVSEVDNPSCGVLYDTFHANIEEKDITESILAVRDCVNHVHISENDRSTPGSGNVRWKETFDTLLEIGYDEILMIEAFGTSLERIQPATKIWRKMYTDELQLVIDGLQFMREQVESRIKGQE
jgi:D-psicose/D-tagatose/L-ribulose 3-epimerase